MKFKILSRNQLENFRFKEKCLVISVSGVDEPGITLNTVKYNNKVKMFLKLHFDDVEKSFKQYKSISKEQANKIVNVYEKWKNKVNLTICSCDAGISRSTAIAAALSVIDNQSDKWVFDNTKYFPNMKVYRAILNSFLMKMVGGNNKPC